MDKDFLNYLFGYICLTIVLIFLFLLIIFAFIVVFKTQRLKRYYKNQICDIVHREIDYYYSIEWHWFGDTKRIKKQIDAHIRFNGLSRLFGVKLDEYKVSKKGD